MSFKSLVFLCLLLPLCTAASADCCDMYDEPAFLSDDYNPLTHKSICYQPMKSGPCLARIERWYYDAAKQKCVRFLFGGCGENQNNFRTLSECISRCHEA
ncbi:Amyloid-like protein 2 like protein [Argiope bruennichi]|uniref:Amyloid-like protein 2 like protein n=1 Tax=Argiope bruennichi TaxID=94029 RepID=A0A8T0EPF1_ARGBR|nr:Amyloid-like protein 2 like protein [Argiope bruennichi]